MLPHQKNKVDISSLSEEEQKIFRLYGKLPSRKDILSNKLKERKYFDSGDYALSKAGKASDVGVTNIGLEHPLPENIPHVHTPTPGTGTSNGSPVKEAALLHSKSPLQEETDAVAVDAVVEEAAKVENVGAPAEEPEKEADPIPESTAEETAAPVPIQPKREGETAKGVPSRWQGTTA